MHRVQCVELANIEGQQPAQIGSIRCACVLTGVQCPLLLCILLQNDGHFLEGGKHVLETHPLPCLGLLCVILCEVDTARYIPRTPHWLFYYI